jgi:hypothetical protein
MIYALLDCSDTIRREHLLAALSVWEYCAASAQYIFGDSLGLPEADEILKALRETPEGRTRSEISDLFRRHKKAAVIEQALRILEERGLARRHTTLTDGRSAEVWRATAKEAKDAK